MTNSVLHSKFWIAACFMLLFAFGVKGQGAVPHIIEEDKIVEISNSGHSSKKAALYSAMLPGLGQAYNHKYWKIPIVYAGIGISAYFIVWNSQQYNDFKTAFDQRQAGETDIYSGVYTDQNLITLQNAYRNQRDLSVIITALFYGLNIIDATIDAHLYDFDVSDDLSMRIEPAVIKSPMYGINGSNFGMRLTLQF